MGLPFPTTKLSLNGAPKGPEVREVKARARGFRRPPVPHGRCHGSPCIHSHGGRGGTLRRAAKLRSPSPAARKLHGHPLKGTRSQSSCKLPGRKETSPPRSIRARTSAWFQVRAAALDWWQLAEAELPDLQVFLRNPGPGGHQGSTSSAQKAILNPKPGRCKFRSTEVRAQI